MKPRDDRLPDTAVSRSRARQPQCVRRQLRAQRRAACARLGERLRRLAPRAVVTCARGSSDHAATFAKYLIETRLGIVTSSAAPSVSSRLRRDSRTCAACCCSRSPNPGASPDLLATVAAPRHAGALVVALVNAESSPLAQAADFTLPLCAGAERSVAATKSYIASLAAIIHLVGQLGAGP